MSARDDAVAAATAAYGKGGYGHAHRMAKAIAAYEGALSAAGWVVAKVSEDAVCTEGSSEIEWAWVSGANHAYAAVRASAVEVE